MIQELIKELQSLSGKYSIWEVWVDFVSVCAIALANSFVKSEEREEQYFKIIYKYPSAQQKKLCGLFQLLIKGMERNSDQDVLGTIVSQLGITDKRKGQYFTPYNVSKLMAGIAMGDLKERKEPLLINEPACGSGANLIAAANIMRRSGYYYHQNAYFVAQDIDRIAAMMCYVQISILGCPGVVIVGDTLVGETQDMEHWYTPFHYLFGESILTRKREIWEQEKTDNQYNRETGFSENWLLQMAGLI